MFGKTQRGHSPYSLTRERFIARPMPQNKPDATPARVDSVTHVAHTLSCLLRPRASQALLCATASAHETHDDPTMDVRMRDALAVWRVQLTREPPCESGLHQDLRHAVSSQRPALRTTSAQKVHAWALEQGQWVGQWVGTTQAVATLAVNHRSKTATRPDLTIHASREHVRA